MKHSHTLCETNSIKLFRHTVIVLLKEFKFKLNFLQELQTRTI
jgi:hypothetical protein